MVQNMTAWVRRAMGRSFPVDGNVIWNIVSKFEKKKKRLPFLMGPLRYIYNFTFLLVSFIVCYLFACILGLNWDKYLSFESWVDFWKQPEIIKSCFWLRVMKVGIINLSKMRGDYKKDKLSFVVHKLTLKAIPRGILKVFWAKMTAH